MKPEQLRKIWENENPFTIEVKEETVDLYEIKIDQIPIEVPPTPIAFFAKNFAQIIYHSTDDLKGRWIKFVLFVYAKGGKIFFSKGTSGNYIAEIKWQ